MHCGRFTYLLPLLMSLLSPGPSAGLAGGQLELIVVDGATGQPIACRMHLRDARGRTRRPTDRTLPFWHDHFVLPGKTVLRLPPGNYEF